MSTWYVKLQLQHRGRLVEHDGNLYTKPIDGEPTKNELLSHVRQMLIDLYPEMRDGKVVCAKAKKLRG